MQWAENLLVCRQQNLQVANLLNSPLKVRCKAGWQAQLRCATAQAIFS